MALAFAGPAASAARFGRRFNAAWVGEALLATVLLNPEGAGVLVNSALAEVSPETQTNRGRCLLLKANTGRDLKSLSLLALEWALLDSNQ